MIRPAAVSSLSCRADRMVCATSKRPFPTSYPLCAADYRPQNISPTQHRHHSLTDSAPMWSSKCLPAFGGGLIWPKSSLLRSFSLQSLQSTEYDDKLPVVFSSLSQLRTSPLYSPFVQLDCRIFLQKRKTRPRRPVRVISVTNAERSCVWFR
jgi:hypothetical protein